MSFIWTSLRRSSSRSNRAELQLRTGSPLLLIALSYIWRRKGGLDAETEELVDDRPGPGAAGSAVCSAGVARELLYREAIEERASPSQASAWPWPAAGIENKKA
jgi:hypothetical protein